MTATGSRPTATDAKARLDGAGLVAMFTAATTALQRNVELINALNAFPVPDSDTGTNMFLTMQDGVQNLEGMTDATVTEVAAAFYSGMEGKGNSGIILSQFFKGFSEGLDGKTYCGGEDFARACDLARECAYKSVTDPVEGTMLTVITSVAEASQETVTEGHNIATALNAASDRARETVAKTIEMLSVLQEAGVVDAGGLGIAVIIEAMNRCAAGEDVAGAASDFLASDIVPLASASISSEFLAAHKNDVYGYCTQFVVEAEELDVDGLRVMVDYIADSTVVTDDGSRARVHGHAEDPGSLISLGISIGSLSYVKIENMDAQFDEFVSGKGVEAEPTADHAVVAVAWGDGFEKVLRSEGATHFVRGGNTMNPSVRELMATIELISAETVYVLPNNKNIVPAARQAAEQSTKSVHVVETASIPQGIAALFGFTPDADADENVRNMEEERSEVKTAEITWVPRTASIEGIDVREGQFLGLLDGKPCTADDDLNRVLVHLVGEAGPEPGGRVTLYWGKMLSPTDAKAASQALQDVYQGFEVEVHQGGQPHYEFIVSIE